MSRRLPRTFDELKGLRSRGLIRESTEEQGEESGPVVQEREERTFAGRWELQPPDRFYTDFRTGSDATKRPEFLQMVADARARLFDVLLVYDTSRFGRNWREVGRFEDEVHKAGVVVAYIFEQQLSSGAGQLQPSSTTPSTRNGSTSIARRSRRVTGSATSGPSSAVGRRSATR